MKKAHLFLALALYTISTATVGDAQYYGGMFVAWSRTTPTSKAVTITLQNSWGQSSYDDFVASTGGLFTFVINYPTAGSPAGAALVLATPSTASSTRYAHFVSNESKLFYVFDVTTSWTATGLSFNEFYVLDGSRTDLGNVVDPATDFRIPTGMDLTSSGGDLMSPSISYPGPLQLLKNAENTVPLYFTMTYATSSRSTPNYQCRWSTAAESYVPSVPSYTGTDGNEHTMTLSTECVLRWDTRFLRSDASLEYTISIRVLSYAATSSSSYSTLDTIVGLVDVLPTVTAIDFREDLATVLAGETRTFHYSVDFDGVTPVNYTAVIPSQISNYAFVSVSAGSSPSAVFTVAVSFTPATSLKFNDYSVRLSFTVHSGTYAGRRKDVYVPFKVRSTNAPTPTPSPTPTASPTCTPSRTPSPTRTQAAMWGDPHIKTLDGMSASYLGCGDCLLLETDDGQFGLQARHCFRDSADGSSTCAVAMRCSAAGDPVEVYSLLKEVVLVAGPTRRTIRAGKDEDITGDDFLISTSDKDKLTVECVGGVTDGAALDIHLRKSKGAPYFDTIFRPPMEFFNQTRGLLGRWDGVKENDVAYSDGRLWKTDEAFTNADSLVDKSLDDVHGSWMVDKEHAMLSLAYEDSDAVCRTTSRRRLLAKSMSPDSELAQEGIRKCADLGLAGAALETCEFDYVASNGDDQLIQNSAAILKML